MSFNQAKMKERGASFTSLVALFAVFVVLMDQTAASESQNGNRIIGGEPVIEGEFPFLARVLTSYSCGGSVIDTRHILTAAHCFDGMPRHEKVAVKLGCHKLIDCVHYEIEDYKIYPKYTDISHYDIAIIRTKKEIIFTGATGAGAVGPIELADDLGSDYLDGELLTVAGWGWLDNNGTRPDVPMKVDLATYSVDNCKAVWSVDESHVCTWSPMKSTCQGDSGGPLFRTDRASRSSSQIGIVSYGSKSCGRAAAVFTRVAAYSEWIAETIRGFEQSAN